MWFGLARTAHAAANDIDSVPDPFAFANVDVGGTSGNVTVNFINNGSGNLTASSATFSGRNSTTAADCQAAFTITTGFTVSSGTGGSTTMTFTPTKVQTYTCTAALFNNGGTQIGTFNFQGAGVGPIVTLSTPTLAFGALRVNDAALTTATRSLGVTVNNNGTADLAITATAISGSGDFTITGGGGAHTVVKGGGAQTITVTYNPASIAAIPTTNLNITASDPVSGKDYSQVVALTGSGTGATINVAPSTFDYGIVGVGGAGTSKTFAVTNNFTPAGSKGPLELVSATITPGTAGSQWFQFGTNGGCAGAQTCDLSSVAVLTTNTQNLDVVCNPPTDGTGTQTATLTVASDTDLGGTNTATLSCTAGHATLAFSTMALPFGDQRVGTTSAAQTVTITNSGNLTGTFTVARTGSTEFASPCTGGGTVAPGGMTTCNFTFTPASLGTGKTATFTFSTNDVDNGSVNVSATGNGVYPTLVAPANVQFGTIDIGASSSTMTLQVTNTGTQTLNISSATIDVNPGSVYTLVTGTTGAQTVAPGASTQWTLTCTPTAQGAQNGDFKILSDAFTSPNPSIPLLCAGQRGQLAGNPNPLDFGPVVVNSTNQKTLTIQNAGNLDVSIATGVLSATNKGYAIHGGFTAFTVPANSSKPLVIDFNPTDTTMGGMVTLTLTGSWMGNASHAITAVITINGSALNADVVLSPSPVDYGSIRYDAPTTQNVCILNGSMVAVHVNAIAITPMAGTLTNEFVYSAGGMKIAPSCTGAPTGSFALGQAVPIGQAVLVPVTAQPQARVGALDADFMITTDIPANPTRHVELKAMSTSGMLDISPMVVDFGPVDVDAGPQTQTVTVTNTGAAPFDLTNWAHTSSDPAALVITTPTGTTTLAPTQTAQVTLTYDPSMVAAVTGSVTFGTAHLLGGGPAAGSVMITGRGIDRSFAVDSAVHFPDTFRNPGTKAPVVNVTVMNTGEAVLHITGVAIAGGPYELADPAATTVDIPGGGSHDFGVKFLPMSAGAAPEGTITFTNDDDAHPMAMVTLDGLCLLPNVALGPMGTIDLGYTAVGVPVTIDDAISVVNMDAANPFVIRDITLADDTAFKVDNAPDNQALAPAGTNTYGITFNADADGFYQTKAVLHLGEDPDEQAEVTVQGTAVFVDLHGGGGCSVGGGGSGGLAIVGAALGLAIRRRRRRAAVVGAVLACTGGAAAADTPGNLDVGVFNPTPATNIGGFQVISPEVGANGDWVAGGVVSYASKPLVAQSSLGEAKLVGARTMFDVGGAYAFLGRFEAGARMPLYSQSGELTGETTMLQGFVPAKGTARGDLTVHAKARLVDTNYVTIGAGVEVTLPTATAGQYTGSDMPSVTALALAALVPHPRLTITANVGAVIRKQEEAANITQGSGLAWGGGIAFRALDKLWLAAEAFGELVPSGHTTMATNGSGMKSTSGLSPVEGLVGVHYRAARALTVGAAVGRGLTTGLGAPDLRGVLAITFAPGNPDLQPIHPPPPPKIDGDADGDGIKDSKDKCPNEAEDKDGFEDDDGCPDLDNDRDGIPDAQDKCPLDPEDKDGFEDGDGCPDKDNDSDGIPDERDKCPNEAEDKDGFQDVDGCPDLDNDHDGIPDAQDKCPNDPETINGNADDDGCPDKGDSAVIVSPDRLELLEPVAFNGSKLTKASFNVLGQVAATLRAHPEIIRVRVTVHAQPTANAQRDQDLTDKRANTVRDWLVQWGIASSRLEARGFGGTKPLVPAGSSGAAAVNDRLELIILERK